MGNVSACNGIYDIQLRYSQYVDNFVVISVVFILIPMKFIISGRF